MASAVKQRITCRGASLPWGIEYSPKCERAQQFAPWELRARKSYDAKSQTFQCRACHGRENSLERLIKQVRSVPYPERIRSRKQLSQLASQRVESDPRWMAQQGGDASKLIEARRAGKGGPKGEAHRLSIMVSAWRKESGPGWKIRACTWCGKLLMLSTAPTAKSYRFHASCWKEARFSPAGRRWWAQRRMLRGRGFDKAAIDKRLGADPPLTDAPGRRSSGPSADLTRSFGWAVRHLMGGEPQTELAKKANVTQQAVAAGIRYVLQRLPENGIAGNRLHPYVKALRAATSPNSL